MGCGSINKGQSVSRKPINTYEAFFEEIEKGAKLVVLGDEVLDISQLILTHPGGPEPLNKYVGMLNDT